jgi:hypothetical protein
MFEKVYCTGPPEYSPLTRRPRLGFVLRQGQEAWPVPAGSPAMRDLVR